MHEDISDRAHHRGREEEHDDGGYPAADPPAFHEADSGVKEGTQEQGHNYQQDDDPQPPQKGQSEAYGHNSARRDERRARDPEVLGVPSSGVIERPVDSLLGHRLKSTPCRTGKG